MTRLLLLPATLGALLLLGACSPSSPPDAPPEGADSAADAGPSPPGEVAEIHLLTLYRMQGEAEGIPCRPGTLQPLAAAAAEKRRLLAAGKDVMLMCVGDTLIPTITNFYSSPRNLSVHTRANVVLEAMAEAGVDVYVPGQADMGLDAAWLLDRCRDLGIPVLMSNVSVEGRDDIGEFMLWTQGGFRLALLGITRGPGSEDVDEVGNGVIVRRARATANQIATRLQNSGEADFVMVLCNVALSPAIAMTKAQSLHAVLGTIGAGDGAAVGAMMREGTAYLLVDPNGLEIGHTMLRVVGGDLQNIVNLSPIHTLPDRIEQDQAELDGYIQQFGTDDLVELARRALPQNPDYFLRKALQIDENRDYVDSLLAHEGSGIDHFPVEPAPVAPDDPVVSRLSQISERLERAFEASSFPPPPPLDPERTIPPPETCFDCHPAQHEHWRRTDHARAFETLVERGLRYDVSCLRCHATGFDKREGFGDPRQLAPFGGVSCYECHMTTWPHIGNVTAVIDTLSTRSESAHMSCGACHTRSRSPEFIQDEELAVLACPPMSDSEAPIVTAREAALVRLGWRAAEGRAQARDPYLTVRALIGLGRVDEALPIARGVLAGAGDDVRTVIELARLLDEAGESGLALRGLGDFLAEHKGDGLANEEHIRLLLEAADPAFRDPEAALRELRFLVPEEDQEGGREHEYVAFRVLKVDALMMLGRQQEAFEELFQLSLKHEDDPLVKRRLRRYLGAPPSGR